MNRFEKLLSLSLLLLCTMAPLVCMDTGDEEDGTVFLETEDDGRDTTDAIPQAQAKSASASPADLAVQPAQPVANQVPAVQSTVPAKPASPAPAVVPLKDDSVEPKLMVSLSPYITIEIAGLILVGSAITGIWYAAKRSVFKQIADLKRLEEKCVQATGVIARGKISFEGLGIELVTCVGLTHELQDKLDNAVALYAVAVQDLCSAVKVHGVQRLSGLEQQVVVQQRLVIC